MNSHKAEVNITIDKHHYKSPNPTTGVALYDLGKVQAGYDLFLEIHGPGDDQLIPRDNSVVNLKDGEKFYSAQQTLNPGGSHGWK